MRAAAATTEAPKVTGENMPAPRAGAAQLYGTAGGGRGSASLGDILERVLDKGLVIAGDIQINLLDIELLTIKLRLLVASVDKAKEMGIDWWEHDPTLSVGDRDLAAENRALRSRLAEIEAGRSDADANASQSSNGSGASGARRPRKAQS